MNKLVLEKLIEVIDELRKKEEEICKLINAQEIDFLYSVIEQIEDCILVGLGIPEYSEEILHYQYEDHIRDGIIHWFYDYYYKRISKEKLILNLLNWKI